MRTVMATERSTVGLSESGRVSHIGVILGAFMNEQDRLDISTLDVKALNCDIRAADQREMHQWLQHEVATRVNQSVAASCKNWDISKHECTRLAPSTISKVIKEHCI